MLPRPLLTILVFALPVLVVTFAVVAGAALLAQGMGDQAGFRGLLWVALAALMLLLIDGVLLLTAVGWRALAEDERREEHRDDPET